MNENGQKSLFSNKDFLDLKDKYDQLNQDQENLLELLQEMDSNLKKYKNLLKNRYNHSLDDDTNEFDYIDSAET